MVLTNRHGTMLWFCLGLIGGMLLVLSMFTSHKEQERSDWLLPTLPVSLRTLDDMDALDARYTAYAQAWLPASVMGEVDVVLSGEPDKANMLIVTITVDDKDVVADMASWLFPQVTATFTQAVDSFYGHTLGAVRVDIASQGVMHQLSLDF